MTENKRFKLHIKWYNIEKTEGEATLTDNGQPLIETEQITDARLLKNILNDLYNENEQLKRQIIDLEEELDYFKAKNGSLETGMFNLERENEQLKRLIDDIKKGRVYDDKRGF